MKKFPILSFFKISVLLVQIFACIENLYAYGTGLSSYPLLEKKIFITTEIVNHLSSGTGLGLQLRVTDKIKPNITVEGGLGFSDGHRSGRFFLASDFELFPDYERQPKISIKPFIENAKEFGSRQTILGAIPIFSKQFFIKEREVFPFASLPSGFTLNSTEKTYQFRSSLALGIASKVHLENFEHLLVNLETNINITNSFSGFFLGLSLPLK